MIAADIVEIDVDALGRRLAHGVGEIARRLVVDGVVDLRHVLQPFALRLRTGGADHGAALGLGDLADHRAHRARGGGDEHRLAVFQFTDLEQACVGGEPRHAERAQIGRERSEAWIDLLEVRAGGDVPFAPAAEMADMVADFPLVVVGGDHLADGAARQHFADLEAIHIARAVGHPPAHIGIDGHIAVADQNLARAGGGDGLLDQLEIGRGGHAGRAGFEQNFTVLLIAHGASFFFSRVFLGFCRVNPSRDGGCNKTKHYVGGPLPLRHGF